MTPENESLSLYFNSLSQVSNELSSKDKEDLSTDHDNFRDTGDKTNYILESADGKLIN